MKYQILKWDSDFFGIKIAKIIEPNILEEELTNILSDLKHEKVQLIYWSANNKYAYPEKLGGKLLDKKTTFTKNLKNLSIKDNHSDIVEPYSLDMNIKELEDLAIQSGEYSRFNVDPNFEKEKFYALYKLWINKSITKKISEEVFVIKEYGKIVGMITVGEKNDRGDIGLLAVDKCCREKKYGEKLVENAQLWFIKNGYMFGQVVTQGMNIPACNFYKKCGYSVEKIEYFYHFWL